VLDIVTFDKRNEFYLYTQRFQTHVSKFMELFKKANRTKIKSKGSFTYERRGLLLGNKNTAVYRKIVQKKRKMMKKDGFHNTSIFLM